MPLASLRRPRPDERDEVDDPPGWSADGLHAPQARRRPGPAARRPVLTAVGVLVVVACAALGAEVATRVDHRAGYLAVAAYVPQGSVIVSGDLAVVRMTSASGVAAIPSAEEATVLGSRASEPLEPGSLLVGDDLSGALPLPAADALVGASLASNQAPAGLAPGDSVIVVFSEPDSDASPAPTAGTTTSPAASSSTSTGQGGPAIGTVYAIAVPSAGDQGDASDDEIVTLEIPKSDAAEVTAASAAGDVSLAEVSSRPSS